jgi:hypothetical protein
MQIKSITILGFKRFHQLTIKDLPSSARLVVLTGPNGSGKSSLFDAFAMWYNYQRDWGNFDHNYHTKSGSVQRGWQDCVRIEFDKPLPENPEEKKKLFYFRSAYRYEPEFTVNGFNQLPSELDDQQRVKRMIQQDVHVSDNYRRMVATTVQDIFDPKNDDLKVSALRDRLIGKIRESMKRVFPDLLLTGTGHPLSQGSFFFDKGESRHFKYMNLSGGEKAGFDLLLDFVVKREMYDNTIPSSASTNRNYTCIVGHRACFLKKWSD